MKTFLTKFIMILSFVGMLFSIWLISEDLKNPGFCPKVLFIPACYLVIIAFFLIYASTYIADKRINSMLFFSGDILGLILAVWFSINQMHGYKECPKLVGIPLCYVSLFAFFILLFLQLNIIIINKTRK